MSMEGFEPRNGLPLILGPVCIGLFVAIITLLVATIVTTLLLFIGCDWASYMHFVGMAIGFAGIALGGIFAGSRSGSRGWLVGLITGGCFVLLCFFLCLLAGVKGIVPSLTAVRMAAACIIGALGGILGVNVRVQKPV